MKIKLVLMAAILFLVNNGYSQVSFGVSPGITMNSAYFGYKIKSKFVPYFGFQLVSANFEMEESGKEYDWESDQVVSFSDKGKISGNIYIPNLGMKYFLKQQNKIQAYVSLNISKPIISAKSEFNGDEDEDLNDAVKNLSIWGGELGFGVEYFFDENFSIGGEFGLRYLRAKISDTYESDYYDPNTGSYVDSENKQELKYRINPTFSKISLNFYF